MIMEQTSKLSQAMPSAPCYAFHKFASKFIPIRAFHKAISRSCVLLRSNTSRLRQRWKIIPLLAHGSRPTGLIQGKASATTRKEMERAKKKRCGFIMFVIESAAAGCGISNDSLARILNQSPEAWTPQAKWSLSSEYTDILLNSFPINLRRHLYPSGHFTKRFPGHAFCCALTQVDKEKQ